MRHGMAAWLAVGLMAACGLGARAADELAPDRHTDRSALWTRSADLIAGFRNMYQMDVVKVAEDDPYPYRAWFFGWASDDGNTGFSGCDAIFAARSKALLSGWEVWAGGDDWDATQTPALWVPVVSASDKFYDEWHNGDPTVVWADGKFHMALSSTGHNLDHQFFGVEGDVDGSILCVMGAESEDGLHWTKSEAPLLLNPGDVGAAHVPSGEAHLFGSYHRPSLLYEDGVWKLWCDYWTGDVTGTSVAYAENRGAFLDPGDWRIVQAGDTPVLPQFPNPDVTRIEDVYFAYGDPPTGHPHLWITRKLTEAISLDGRHWLVLGCVEPDDDAQAIHVPQALVEKTEGGWDLWVTYACQIGGEVEAYDYRYNRIRAMRRLVTEADLARYRELLTEEFGG